MTGIAQVIHAASLILALLAFCHFDQEYPVLLLAVYVGVGFIFRGVATTVSAVSDPILPARRRSMFVGVTSLIAGIVVMASPLKSIIALRSSSASGSWSSARSKSSPHPASTAHRRNSAKRFRRVRKGSGCRIGLLHYVVTH
jgi:hypothetical protein